MTKELPAPDEAYQKKKKSVVVIGAILVMLLGGALIIGQACGLTVTETPSPTVIAVVTTLAPPTTAPPTATATETPLPTITPVVSPTVEPPTPTPPPTITPQPPTPTLPPSPTPKPSTPTPSPSPTPPPATPTPTATPTTPHPPVIENPADGSELPSEGLKVDGTAEPGTTVRVYKDDTSLGEAPVDEGGNWSLVPTEQLSASDHTIVAVDVATGETSAPVTFTLLAAWLPITGSE